MKTKYNFLIILMVSLLFSELVLAASTLEDRAARFEFKGNVEVMIGSGQGILRLRKVAPEIEKQILADLKRADAAFERVSSISISEEGLVMGIAKKSTADNSSQLYLFMFQPNSQRPSIFMITDVFENRIKLQQGYANVMGNGR